MPKIKRHKTQGQPHLFPEWEKRQKQKAKQLGPELDKPLQWPEEVINSGIRVPTLREWNRLESELGFTLGRKPKDFEVLKHFLGEKRAGLFFQISGIKKQISEAETVNRKEVLEKQLARCVKEFNDSD